MKMLREVKTLNVAGNLKGKTVLASVTNLWIGEVVKIFIHPTTGQLALMISQAHEHNIHMLASTALTIENGILRVAAEALRTGSEAELIVGGFFALEDILEALVVTDQGRLLGRVSEVHLSVENHLVYYWVVKSEWQRLMGGGFFMAGDVPHSYFQHNRRLIVPANAENRYGITPLGETP
jgi:hypothetical protein